MQPLRCHQMIGEGTLCQCSSHLATAEEAEFFRVHGRLVAFRDDGNGVRSP